MRQPFALLLVSACMVAAGCRPESAPPNRAVTTSSTSPRARHLSPTPLRDPPSSRPVRDVPIILYLIDTLRADRVGAYGNAAGLTPRMDAIARDGVVFEQAYAPAPWTLPSVVSLFTSQFATEHGVIEVNRRLSPSARPLGKRLVERGYRCAAFVSNSFSMAAVGSEHGYEPSRLMGKLPQFAAMEQWLASVKPPRLHLFVHTTEPHNPYEADPEWIKRFGNVSPAQLAEVNAAMKQYRELTRVDFMAKRPRGTTDNTAEQDAAMARLHALLPTIRTLYDAQVAFADRHVGEFIDLLKRRGIWDDCLFVLLADHGEELDDHGGWEHDHSLYEELMHVPLIVRFPKNEHAGLRVSEPVGLVDVMPTVLDVIGASGELDSCRGYSLLEPIDGLGREGPRVLAVRANQRKYYRPYKERRGDFNIALRQGVYKGIWNTQVHTFELYDLNNDPGERNDVAAQRKSVADPLQAFARQWLREQARDKGVAASAPMSRGEEERLRQLGYIGGDEPGGAPAEKRQGSASKR